MNQIIKDLGINETFTRVKSKSEGNNRILNNIRHEANYNAMVDLLMLPQTKKGYRYLFVMVDMYTTYFDCEPMKGKTAKDTLAALKAIMNRNVYIGIPMAIQTDSGSEFKGEFTSYLFRNNILHSVTLPGRHKQMSFVESLNRQLGRLLNGYMNMEEEKRGVEYSEWTEILPKVIELLNKHKVKTKGDIFTEAYKEFEGPDKPPTFKAGDLVHQRLDRPENALGHRQNTEKFREGDYRYSREPKRIVKVLLMNDKPYYRYMLNGITNVSYTASELMKSQQTAETQVVKQIIGKKSMKGKIYYLVWWRGELKKQASWEPRTNLIEDGLKSMLTAYDRDQR